MTYEENKNQEAQIPKEDQEYLRKAESELPDANVSADNASTDNVSTNNASTENASAEQASADNAPNNGTSQDEEPAENTSADDGIDDQEHITGDMHPTTRTETSQEERNAEQED